MIFRAMDRVDTSKSWAMLNKRTLEQLYFMLKHINWKGLLGILLIIATPLQAEVFQVLQKDGKFSASEIEAQVGDSVMFTNQDPHKHNIFSLSQPQMFDLGELAQGEQRELVLKKAGLIKVGCGIHGRAKLTILVRQKLDQNQTVELMLKDAAY